MHRIATVGLAVLALAAPAACSSRAPTATAPPVLASATAAPHVMESVPSAKALPHRRVHPAFRWSSHPVTAAELGRSWHRGCPVGPASLRAVTARIWGFDHTAHTGSLVVNGVVVPAVVSVLRSLYASRFPIRRMVPIAAYGGNDDRSTAADNTSAFNCRYAVADGPKHWSMHAFGEAIDVNTVENPYVLNGHVSPPSGRRYAERSRARPGMAVPGGPLVVAFERVVWGWGGRWRGSPDYQHFSTDGR